jgi:hypothetical protein
MFIFPTNITGEFYVKQGLSFKKILNEINISLNSQCKGKVKG